MTRNQKQAAYNAAHKEGNAMLLAANKTPFHYNHAGQNAWYNLRVAAYDFIRNRLDEIDAEFNEGMNNADQTNN